jgi:phosphoribosylanthranilate isomerase/indole-3-glycerol phosphate synthase/phosphoribosylanthranilate isomerase
MKIEKEDRADGLKYTPQIKICGLTGIDDAVKCAQLGADAIGLVFHPKSPRFVTDDRAREICFALPERVKRVGVFVDETFASIMQKVEICGINAVQLHGNEPPELVTCLRRENLIVIKALFFENKPSLEDAVNYEASAFLAECGKGALPGGNALSWDWEKAKIISGKYPLILAGGLTPENVFHSISLCLPDAVDVSSGVESAPGIKNIEKAKLFISRMSESSPAKRPRRIF